MVLSWNILRAAAEVGLTVKQTLGIVLINLQLGITRVTQASSVNVVRLVWSVKPKLYYLPLDEEHPREPDEPYGLSKLYVQALLHKFESIRLS